jgi:hypothetical protein
MHASPISYELNECLPELALASYCSGQVLHIARNRSANTLASSFAPKRCETVRNSDKNKVDIREPLAVYLMCRRRIY